MKIVPIAPPRVFKTGRAEPIEIRDCARIALEPDEQVTFTTDAGAEYDVARKAWGFYATPSLNGRLVNFGLRAALARSYLGMFYVFLVEAGKEAAFEAYTTAERNEVVRWLDNGADLAAIPRSAAAAPRERDVHCMCGVNRFTTVHNYFAPPRGEVSSFTTADGCYRREVVRCSVCAHFVSLHEMGSPAFYEGGYVDATYGDAAGLRRAFERIVSLPAEKSDNAGRVARVVEFTSTYFGAAGTPRRVLDVGAGLCVFLHRMQAAGWDCTALDPDPRAAEHARSVGVTAVAADFRSATDLGVFDLVTFNKVLEHVPDPVAMLRQAAQWLAPAGLIYAELPDGEAAALDPDGFGREEFFIEHDHVFSPVSLATLTSLAGFRLLTMERLREPSGKYTLRMFATRT